MIVQCVLIYVDDVKLIAQIVYLVMVERIEIHGVKKILIVCNKIINNILDA